MICFGVANGESPVLTGFPCAFGTFLVPCFEPLRKYMVRVIAMLFIAMMVKYKRIGFEIDGF